MPKPRNSVFMRPAQPGESRLDAVRKMWRPRPGIVCSVKMEIGVARPHERAIVIQVEDLKDAPVEPEDIEVTVIFRSGHVERFHIEEAVYLMRPLGHIREFGRIYKHFSTQHAEREFSRGLFDGLFETSCA